MGRGPNGFNGYHGGMMGSGFMGAMHEYMLPAMAEALGLDAEELAARHDAGETLWDIAAAEGFTEEETYALMQSAHTAALAAAVEAGDLTAEEAEWMNEHMKSMGGRLPGGYGPGHCNDQPFESEDL
jgi:hypothetical protein